MIKIKTPEGYEIEASKVEDALEILREMKQVEVTVEVFQNTDEENFICTNCQSNDTEAYEEEDGSITVYCLNENCGYEFKLSER